MLKDFFVFPLMEATMIVVDEMDLLLKSEILKIDEALGDLFIMSQKGPFLDFHNICLFCF